MNQTHSNKNYGEKLLKLLDFYNFKHIDECLKNLNSFYKSIDNIHKYIDETEPMLIFHPDL